jgi:hypothetical protein
MEQRDKILSSVFDDENQSRTEELTKSVLIIQSFHDCYLRTIQEWRVFERQEIMLLNLSSFNGQQTIWNGYLSDIKTYISELESCTMRLLQHVKFCERMRAGVSVSFWFGDCPSDQGLDDWDIFIAGKWCFNTA